MHRSMSSGNQSDPYAESAQDAESGGAERTNRHHPTRALKKAAACMTTTILTQCLLLSIISLVTGGSPLLTSASPPPPRTPPVSAWHGIRGLVCRQACGTVLPVWLRIPGTRLRLRSTFQFTFEKILKVSLDKAVTGIPPSFQKLRSYEAALRSVR